jgi:hypothetical protein
MQRKGGENCRLSVKFCGCFHFHARKKKGRWEGATCINQVKIIKRNPQPMSNSWCVLAFVHTLYPTSIILLRDCCHHTLGQNSTNQCWLCLLSTSNTFLGSKIVLIGMQLKAIDKQQCSHQWLLDLPLPCMPLVCFKHHVIFVENLPIL